MWFKVTKPFAKLKVGDVIELKEDSQYPILVSKGWIEETEAPKVEVKEVDPNSINSVSGIVDKSNTLIDSKIQEPEIEIESEVENSEFEEPEIASDDINDEEVNEQEKVETKAPGKPGRKPSK